MSNQKVCWEMPESQHTMLVDSYPEVLLIDDLWPFSETQSQSVGH
jgi:hypothetical protein